jgi:hypothetical protein
MEISTKLPQKSLKVDLIYDPSVFLLGKYPKESKSAYNRDICTPMFTVTVFIIVELRNYPRGQLGDK